MAASAAILISTVAVTADTRGPREAPDGREGRASARPVAGAVVQDPPQRTVKDGVYAAAQATAGKALFDSTCANCHAFKPWEKSELSPDLAGAAFLDRWNGKSVKELASLIFQTMPNDGSAFLDEKQSIELTAYILQQNGFPAGEQALASDDLAARTTIVK